MAVSISLIYRYLSSYFRRISVSRAALSIDLTIIRENCDVCTYVDAMYFQDPTFRIGMLAVMLGCYKRVAVPIAKLAWNDTILYRRVSEQ